MQRWLSDDTDVPFIVNFSSAQTKPRNSDGYGENINCVHKRSQTGISKPELYLHVYMQKILMVISVIFYISNALSESFGSGLKYFLYFLSVSGHTHS